MGYRKEKKPKNRYSHTGLLNLRSDLRARYPVFLFLLLFAILMFSFYIMWLSDEFKLKLHPKILFVNARISNDLLNLFGQNTRVSEESIYSNYFSIVISRGCDAIQEIALFTSAVLAFNSGWRAKVIGLAAGIVFLFVMNIVRIVSLFLCGVYYPGIFDTMHVEIWPTIFIILAIVLWLLWLRFIALPKLSLNDVKNEANT